MNILLLILSIALALLSIVSLISNLPGENKLVLRIIKK